MTTWTKFSERLPEESVSEVFVLWHTSGVHVETKGGGEWNHWYRRAFQKQPVAWHPITYPGLPKEPTQLDTDNSRCERSWLEAGTGASLPEFRCGFYAALKYERAEVAKELDKFLFRDLSPVMGDAVARLRKRCGLDK